MKMKLLTMGLLAALMMVATSASAMTLDAPSRTAELTATQVPTIPAEALAAQRCNPDDPLDAWLICVLGDTLDFPEWVWDTIVYALNLAFTVYYRAISEVCFVHGHVTGDPCPV